MRIKKRSVASENLYTLRQIAAEATMGACAVIKAGINYVALAWLACQ